MTTGTLLPAATEPVSKYPELIEWRKQDQAIAEMRERYMTLKIDGLDDKKGFAAVHDARMIVKNNRVAVEKKRKELKEDALNYGRLVDSEARRLTAMLESIESHLEAEESAVTDAKEKIKHEAEEARQRALQARMDALAEYQVYRPVALVSAMAPEEFAGLLSKSKTAFDERQRLEVEADAKRKEQEEALAAERARLEKIKRQQKAKSDRLAAEQKKLDDERLARERAAELEKAKAEAAEKARVEVERKHAEELARIQHEAEEKAARERAEAEAKAAREKAAAEAAEAARLKAEAERPQREKIESVARQVELIPIPKGQGESAVRMILKDAAERVRKIARGPLAA